MFEDISDRQNNAFGNAENGRLWRSQNTDNQYRYSHKITPNSTGKELDAETGYSYFGARYLDHELLISWLSVDPMADKYPSISPYAYCAWNPLKLVDPEGEEIDDYFSYDGKYLGSDNARTDNVRIIDESLWNTLSHDGMIEHSVGNQNSQLFSAAHSTMTEDAQLEVYQHYNPTKCKLFATSYRKNPRNFGMVTIEKNKKFTIGIFLEGNFSNGNLADYANEIINLFAHENRHVEDKKKNRYTFDYEYENSAIMAQINHNSWSKCRDEYKRAIIRYGRKESTLPSVVLDFWEPYVNPILLTR